MGANRPQKKKVTLSDCLGGAIKYYMEHSEPVLAEKNNFFLFDEIVSPKTNNFHVQLGIENDKKNVFILPHGLIDIPRETSRIYFYYDYRDWFLKTINIIKNISNVNWIIKDHPLASYYKQNDYVKQIFMENKTSNMYWCDSNVYGLELKEVADCIVTCGGEAGLEFWAYGIPTITSTENYYTMEHISYNVKSQEEYENVLRKIPCLAKPSAESSKKAQEILFAMKQMSDGETQDKLSSLLTVIYHPC